MADTNPIIISTIGRVIWFYPAPKSGDAGFASNESGGPYAVIIVRVWNDKMVNLTVFDANGAPHSRTSVALVQGEMRHPTAPSATGCRSRRVGPPSKMRSPRGGRPPAYHRAPTGAGALGRGCVGRARAEVGQQGSTLGKEVRESLDALFGGCETKSAPQVIALSVRDRCAAAGVTAEWPVDQGRTFGAALAELKNGRRVARGG